MADEVPFARYNKQDEAPTLIGNWVEERNLKEMTGTTRNMGATQVLHDTFADSAEKTTRSRGNTLQATHPRVIEHVYAQTMAEAMMREARELPEEVQATLSGPAVPVTTESVYGGDFKSYDLTGLSVGARVMKDPDGRAATRDPNFLAESSMMEKQSVDRIMEASARLAGARDTALLPNPDVPITLYTEAVANKTYGGVFPGTTTLNGASPFGKASNFTKPISEYNKVVVD
ncbi:hypothetical protein TSOC_007785, partial [Tetrabaena socialis]